MSNIRIVRTNLADTATLTADQEAGTLVVENLQVDRKTQAWRSTGLTPTITVNFSPAQSISMVSLAFASLASAATMTVKGYTLTGDVVAAFDTGAVSCCPSGPLSDLDWGNDSAGINSVSVGGGVYATSWFAGGSVERLTIALNDTGNALGYIEAGKLIVGDYWEANVNADYGASITYDDRSTNSRNDSGDLVTERGTKNKKMSFGFGFMAQSDRNYMTDLAVNNGVGRPFFVSLFPEDTDNTLEQIHQLYAKVQTASPITNAFYSRSKTQLRVEEV